MNEEMKKGLNALIGAMGPQELSEVTGMVDRHWALGIGPHRYGMQLLNRLLSVTGMWMPDDQDHAMWMHELMIRKPDWEDAMDSPHHEYEVMLLLVSDEVPEDVEQMTLEQFRSLLFISCSWIWGDWLPMYRTDRKGVLVAVNGVPAPVVFLVDDPSELSGNIEDTDAMWYESLKEVIQDGWSVLGKEFKAGRGT